HGSCRGADRDVLDAAKIVHLLDHHAVAIKEQRRAASVAARGYFTPHTLRIERIRHRSPRPQYRTSHTPSRWPTTQPEAHSLHPHEHSHLNIRLDIHVDHATAACFKHETRPLKCREARGSTFKGWDCKD